MAADTAVSRFSDDLVEAYAAALPELATADGISDHDDKLRDWSLAGLAAQHDLYRTAHARASTLVPVDDWDRLAHQVLLDEIDRELDWYASDEPLRDLNHVFSGLQQIRDAFDLMATDTAEDWDRIISRLYATQQAFEGYRERLEEGRRTGALVQARQVRAAVDQTRAHASATSGLLDFDARLAESDHTHRRDELRSALDTAQAAFGGFGDYLHRDYLPSAPQEDGVGRDRYTRGVRRWVGAQLDLEATYDWGWAEVRRLWTEMQDVARAIVPESSVPEVLEVLKTDPARAAASRAEFLDLMTARQDQALAELDGDHFQVPPQIRTLEVKFAPPGGSLGAYYTAPSEDFTRPGAVWYAVPEDQQVFPLYDEVTTAYHEGFPGHHLQIGMVACFSDLLTRFHRKVVWMSGSGEGWALYAEQLMRDLGYLEKPDYVMGLLASQMMRACRVAVDIGFHLGLAIPDDAAGLDLGEDWTFDAAVRLMRERAFLSSANAESEVIRYLGWPGQAISYKVGEQAIVDLRREVQRRLGTEFDLGGFHRRVLEAGAVGLDLLRSVVLAATTDDRPPTADTR